MNKITRSNNFETSTTYPADHHHQNIQQAFKSKKCSMCDKINVLLRLPEEFQQYAKKKNFESFFCCSCIQIINFVYNQQQSID